MTTEQDRIKEAMEVRTREEIVGGAERDEWIIIGLHCPLSGSSGVSVPSVFAKKADRTNRRNLEPEISILKSLALSHCGWSSIMDFMLIVFRAALEGIIKAVVTVLIEWLIKWEQNGKPASIILKYRRLLEQRQNKEKYMINEDIIAGKAKQVEGKVQDAAGDITDSPADDIKGKMKEAEGKVQEDFGKAKEAVKDAVDHK